MKSKNNIINDELIVELQEHGKDKQLNKQEQNKLDREAIRQYFEKELSQVPKSKIREMAIKKGSINQDYVAFSRNDFGFRLYAKTVFLTYFFPYPISSNDQLFNLIVQLCAQKETKIDHKTVKYHISIENTSNLEHYHVHLLLKFKDRVQFKESTGLRELTLSNNGHDSRPHASPVKNGHAYRIIDYMGKGRHELDQNWGNFSPDERRINKNLWVECCEQGMSHLQQANEAYDLIHGPSNLINFKSMATALALTWQHNKFPKKKTDGVISLKIIPEICNFIELPMGDVDNFIYDQARMDLIFFLAKNYFVIPILEDGLFDHLPFVRLEKAEKQLPKLLLMDTSVVINNKKLLRNSELAIRTQAYGKTVVVTKDYTKVFIREEYVDEEEELGNPVHENTFQPLYKIKPGKVLKPVTRGKKSTPVKTSFGWFTSGRSFKRFVQGSSRKIDALLRELPTYDDYSPEQSVDQTILKRLYKLVSTQWAIYQPAVIDAKKRLVLLKENKSDKNTRKLIEKEQAAIREVSNQKIKDCLGLDYIKALNLNSEIDLNARVEKCLLELDLMEYKDKILN